jgi:hypothetical protein
MIYLLPTLTNELLRILLRILYRQLHPFDLRLIFHLFMQIQGHTGGCHLRLLGDTLVVAQVWALDDQILGCFGVERALELFLLKPPCPNTLLLGWTVDFDDLSVLDQCLWLPLRIMLLLVWLR